MVDGWLKQGIQPWGTATGASVPPPLPQPRLWPVLAVGFKDLLSRASAQQQAIEENQGRLRSLGELQHRMARQHAVELKGRAAEVQKRHIELSHRLMHVTRLLDALDSRLASNLGWVVISVECMSKWCEQAWVC